MTPVRPAPYRSVGRPSVVATPAAAGRSDAARIANRTPPRIATATSASMNQNERGKPMAQDPFRR